MRAGPARRAGKNAADWNEVRGLRKLRKALQDRCDDDKVAQMLLEIARPAKERLG